MRYVDEFRDSHLIEKWSSAIAAKTKHPWTLMEICGGQTHSIVKYGLTDLLPSFITLVHGPGCPVCVTSVGWIDKAIEIASKEGTILCSFGDMLRVPGTDSDLLEVKARGGEVRTVYSPTEALEVAEKNPNREVVFFAVGFETTAPATAMAVYQARERKLKNLSFLVCHVLVPPAMEALLSSPQNRVQGFLAAGHVCTVMGYEEYEPIAKKYRVPIVVTGFEPVDILEAVHACVAQLESGRFVVENQYRRSVRSEGNESARKMVREVFSVVKRDWRGLGEIPESGLALSAAYFDYDAEKRFGPVAGRVSENTKCIAGLVLQGLARPKECPSFGRECTPENPLGAPMVSSEGACAAYFRYREHEGRG